MTTVTTRPGLAGPLAEAVLRDAIPGVTEEHLVAVTHDLVDTLTADHVEAPFLDDALTLWRAVLDTPPGEALPHRLRDMISASADVPQQLRWMADQLLDLWPDAHERRLHHRLREVRDCLSASAALAIIGLSRLDAAMRRLESEARAVESAR